MGMEGMRFETGMGQTPKNTHESDAVMENMHSKVVEGVDFSHSSAWDRILDEALEKMLQQSGIDTGNKDLIAHNMERIVLDKLRDHAGELKGLTSSWERSMSDVRYEDIEKAEKDKAKALTTFIQGLFAQERKNLIAMATEVSQETFH